MSGPSMLEPQFSRRDSDPPWMHRKRCAACGEPLDPDLRIVKHGEAIHEGCESLFCQDCDECDIERQAEAAMSAAERAREK